MVPMAKIGELRVPVANILPLDCIIVILNGKDTYCQSPSELKAKINHGGL